MIFFIAVVVASSPRRIRALAQRDIAPPNGRISKAVHAIVIPMAAHESLPPYMSCPWAISIVVAAASAHGTIARTTSAHASARSFVVIFGTASKRSEAVSVGATVSVISEEASIFAGGGVSFRIILSILAFVASSSSV